MSDLAWQPAETAPKDQRVRVKHERGTYGSGKTTGEWDGQEWSCSEAFIDPHTMRIYWRPTHWAPLSSTESPSP